MLVHPCTATPSSEGTARRLSEPFVRFGRMLRVGGAIACSARGVLRARALLAQPRERVKARVMAVAPLRCDRIAADAVDGRHLRLGRGERRVRVKPTGYACLAAAVRARTQPTQGLEVVRGYVPVRPLESERALCAVG